MDMKPTNDDVEVVNRTARNFKTKIGKQYSAKDVIKVWDCISKWIENNTDRDKGVRIKGIGYFTVAKWEINVSQGNPYTIRKPVFVIDEKLAKDYNLKRNRAYNTGNIHQYNLSLLSVAQDYGLSIDKVTHCFQEVVDAFKKLLYEEKDCELPFSKIGKLQIKNKTVTMKFYRDFMERQNQNLKNRTNDEKRLFQSVVYNPNWNAGQYENQKRPCSAMSIISRPASSLSQYRPGLGYESVLPDSCNNGPTTRPGSRLSVRSDGSATRPGSRLSVRSDGSATRPGSRLSVRSDGSATRPDSRLSVRSDRSATRPDSRLSVRSDGPATRPGSGLFVRSDGPATRPGSGLSVRSDGSRIRPDSRLSVRSDKRTVNGPRSRTPSVCSTGSAARRQDSMTKLSVRPDSKHSISKERQVDGCKKMTFATENYDDKTLCYSCNVRKNRWHRTSALKPEELSTNHAGDFMRGGNPINRQSNTEIVNKRKDRLKEISSYNYATAKELLDAIDNEKNRLRREKNVDNYILNKRPSSISDRAEKTMNFKNSLLNQIERNNIKKETDRDESLKAEIAMQKELLKSLHDERMRNVAAKNRSKENYLALCENNAKIRQRAAAEKNATPRDDGGTTAAFQSVLGVGPQDERKPDDVKRKNRLIAEYQMKQKIARNVVCREQKEKNINFEKSLLNRLKEEDETFREKMLQKKLNRRRFLTEDFNKLLAASETERRKNQIPGAYPMNFPLKKLVARCRLCKKNKLGLPTEKISDYPCR